MFKDRVFYYFKCRDDSYGIIFIDNSDFVELSVSHHEFDNFRALHSDAKFIDVTLIKLLREDKK